jgi:hypothetical protein
MLTYTKEMDIPPESFHEYFDYRMRYVFHALEESPW